RDGRIRDPSDLIVELQGEPQVGVWSRRNGWRLGLTVSGNRELRDHSCGGDLPDLGPLVFGEPQVPVWTGCDASHQRTRGGNDELRDDARGRHSADGAAW